MIQTPLSIYASLMPMPVEHDSNGNEIINGSRPRAYRKWTAEDNDFLIRNYAKYGVFYCGKKLGRSPTSVKRRAAELGCCSTKHYTKRDSYVGQTQIN